MKNLSIILFAITILIFACQCKDDDDMNPCDVEGLAPVNAQFTTSYEMGWQDSTRRFQADTFINYFPIIFTAQEENATYQWKVGDDPRDFDEKEFNLTFIGTTGPIDIQLIVDAEPNLECFPEDDGRDTISKTIYFVEKLDSPMLGKYRGVVTSVPNDTFEIDVASIPPFYDSNNIDNLPDGCIRDEDRLLGFLLGYRTLRMANLGNYAECPEPQGWGYLNYHDIITLEYSIWNPNIEQVVSDSFVGKKIN